MDIDTIRKICTALPAVTEDIKWEYDLVFSVGGKMFCVTSLEPPFGCSFKVKDEDFEELSNRPGFIPAPYMARAKWVKVDENARILKKEWQGFINQSYELVKAKLTKKEKMKLGIE
jgi:predicted DNA-binding protein (MmcQ/YjbR family)